MGLGLCFEVVEARFGLPDFGYGVGNVGFWVRGGGCRMIDGGAVGRGRRTLLVMVVVRLFGW